MKANLTQWIIYGALMTGWMTGIGGCSTTELNPPAPPPAEPPPYVLVPHPAGTDLGDLRGMMLSPETPSQESLKTCDADFMKLRLLTVSEEERRQGARELVKRNPVEYHWCYYGKLLELEGILKSSSAIDERQKKTIEAYQFLVPVARGFLSEFHDSRYLRFAMAHYKRISEWVFFRRLELTPAATSELVQVANPFGLWRDPAPQTTILEKYGIIKPMGDAMAGAEVKNIFPPTAAEPEVILDRKPAGIDAPVIPATPPVPTDPVTETVPANFQATETAPQQ